MNIGYSDTKNKQGGSSPLFSKEDDKKKEPKTGASKDIEVKPKYTTSGTSTFPTKVSNKQLANMAVDVASFAIPGGAVFKGAKLLGKFLKAGKAAKNISKAIPKKNISKAIPKKVTSTSIDKGPSNWILTSMKKKPTEYKSIYKGKTNREGYFGMHNKVNK